MLHVGVQVQAFCESLWEAVAPQRRRGGSWFGTNSDEILGLNGAQEGSDRAADIPGVL